MANGLLRAGRMRIRADGHHLGAAGRGERSGSAPRHRGHRVRLPCTSIPASHDRLARRSQVHESRRSVRSLSPVLHSEQRHARRRRGCRCRRGLPVRGEALRIDPGRPNARAAASDRTSSDWRTACAHRARRHDQLREDGLPCAGGHGRGLLSFARPRRGAHRCKGRESVVQFPRRAAAAKSSPVYGAGRGPARVDGVGGLASDAGALPLYAFLHGAGGSGSGRPRRGGASSARVRAPGRDRACRVDSGAAPASGAAGLRKRQRHQHCPPAWLFRDRGRPRVRFDTAATDRRGDARAGVGRGAAPPRPVDEDGGVFRPVTRARSGPQPPERAEQ